jgi:arginine metabolism regulation protein II
VPATTQHLLRHYRTNMGNWFSPLNIKRHPWSVLHLPIALSAVSELSIWGKTTHARITVFRALLAVSAFTLNHSISPFWQEVGIRNKTLAKSEMKHCLTKELYGPHRAKYQDILVALLSLVSISVGGSIQSVTDEDLTLG